MTASRAEIMAHLRDTRARYISADGKERPFEDPERLLHSCATYFEIMQTSTWRIIDEKALAKYRPFVEDCFRETPAIPVDSLGRVIA